MIIRYNKWHRVTSYGQEYTERRIVTSQFLTFHKTIKPACLKIITRKMHMLSSVYERHAHGGASAHYGKGAIRE